MNVTDKVLHAMRKAFCVDDKVTIRISLGSDALLNQHVAISQIAHSARYKRICLVANRPIGIVAEEMIPTGPPHRRRGSQARLKNWASLAERKLGSNKEGNKQKESACQEANS
jgi:hypothetical protein